MPVGCLCCSNAENVEHPGGNPTRFLRIFSAVVIFHTDYDDTILMVLRIVSVANLF